MSPMADNFRGKCEVFNFFKTPLFIFIFNQLRIFIFPLAVDSKAHPPEAECTGLEQLDRLQLELNGDGTEFVQPMVAIDRIRGILAHNGLSGKGHSREAFDRLNIRDHIFAVGGGFHHEDFYFINLSVGVSGSASFFLPRLARNCRNINRDLCQSSSMDIAVGPVGSY